MSPNYVPLWGFGFKKLDKFFSLCWHRSEFHTCYRSWVMVFRTICFMIKIRPEREDNIGQRWYFYHKLIMHECKYWSTNPRRDIIDMSLFSVNWAFFTFMHLKGFTSETLFNHAEAINLSLMVYKPWKYVPQICPSMRFYIEKIWKILLVIVVQVWVLYLPPFFSYGVSNYLFFG